MLTLPIPNYQFCPLCGAKLMIKTEEGKDRKYCPNDNWIYYPRVATSAAAIIIHQDKVLMVKRNRDPYKGTWMFPAGYVDYGEHPEETIRREVTEETGLTAKKVIFVDVVQSVDDYREPGHFLFFYKVTVEDGTLKNGDKEENQDLQWLPIHSDINIGWVTHKEMMKKLRDNVV